MSTETFTSNDYAQGVESFTKTVAGCMQSEIYARDKRPVRSTSYRIKEWVKALCSPLINNLFHCWKRRWQGGEIRNIRLSDQRAKLQLGQANLVEKQKSKTNNSKPQIVKAEECPAKDIQSNLESKGQDVLQPLRVALAEGDCAAVARGTQQPIEQDTHRATTADKAGTDTHSEDSPEMPDAAHAEGDCVAVAGGTQQPIEQETHRVTTADKAGIDTHSEDSCTRDARYCTR